MDILLNFAENGHFGCSMQCPFCLWSEMDYGQYWYPDDVDLDKCIELSPHVIKLSGGGDPLFNFEHNQEKLKHIVNYLTTRGVRVGIYTHDIGALDSYRHILSKWPVFFVISVSKLFSKLEQEICDYYYDTGQLRRLSVVWNENNTDEPPYHEIDHVIDYCQKHPRLGLTIREHWKFYYPLDVEQQMSNYVKQFKSINFVPGSRPLKFRVMFEGKITTCAEIDKTVLGIQK